jgi:glycosyltransferase involved in cell wall biosynthesis
LDRLLRNLAIQRTAGLFVYSVVVVDNDASGCARETVSRIQTELHLDVTYSIEPEHTIPAARNHALRLARGNYVAIIDDDEFPPPDWLLRLFDGIQTFAVDGVLGPVYPFFADAPPNWLSKSGMCDLPVYRTGTLLHWSQTCTGNVMVKKEVFERHNLSFDLRFKTGGSDQELFRQAMARGCRFVTVAEAPVYEVFPPARLTRKYWIKRALVNGFNARKYAVHGMSSTQQAILICKSAIGAAIYAMALPVCVLLGQHRVIICLEKGCYHLSRTCASFGIELWKRRDF